MILVDANLLIYAAHRQAPSHPRAREWLESTLNEVPRVGIPWSSLWAFVRITTNPRLLNPPLSTEAAWEYVEDWLDAESVWVPGPTEAHRKTLGQLLKLTAASGAKAMDAAVASIAIEHGLTLCTTDSDFAAFPGLRWKNPIA